jgi:hypothetical protein
VAITDIPAGKAALVAAISARPAIHDAPRGAEVVVQLGLPADLPTERRRIYVTRVDPATRTPLRAQQAAVRSDTVEVVLVVEAHEAERDPAIAEGITWGLVEEIDAALAEQPELGGLWRARMRQAQEDDTAAMPDGWLARIFVRVLLEAVTV